MEDARIYDIYKAQPEGRPLRITSVVGLEKAKLQLSMLTQNSTAKYFAIVARNNSVPARGAHA